MERSREREVAPEKVALSLSLSGSLLDFYCSRAHGSSSSSPKREERERDELVAV
jgi:hypothetical protein